MAYTTIDDPSAYFQTAIYSGSNSELAVTNDGNSDLKPDWLWIKQRSSTENHMVVDSTRGVTKYLSTDSTAAEATVTSRVETLDTDGFTLNGASNPVNALGATYVGWQWKANGGTTSSNTEGNVTNTLQVNQDAGFSISKFTSIISGNTTIGHGLGVTPDVFIVKTASGTGGWWMNHKGLTNQSDRYVGLDSTQAETTLSWGAAPTSTLITAAPGFIGNGTTTVMCYAFAEKQGYSKFGNYVGNGSADGPFVYTGFRPAFIITKKSSAAGGGWFMQDIKRGIKNNDTTTPVLQANGSFSEADVGTTNYEIDFLSNGFKLRDDNTYVNLSATTYIYMAFAENPFTTSTGIPATAR
jgi:hypothetical protein